MHVQYYRIQKALGVTDASQPGPSSHAALPVSVAAPGKERNTDLSWVPGGPWVSDVRALKEKGVQLERELIWHYMAEDNPNIRQLKAGRRMFCSGHVEKVEMHVSEGRYTYRANVYPSMKTHKTYHPVFTLAKGSEPYKIQNAYCQCMGGIMGTCVHISAVLHALAFICEKPLPARALQGLGIPPTSMQCQWLPARERKVRPGPAETLDIVKHEGRPKKKARKDISGFDPRPPIAKRQVLKERTNQFCRALQEIRIKNKTRIPTCAELILTDSVLIPR